MAGALGQEVSNHSHLSEAPPEGQTAERGLSEDGSGSSRAFNDESQTQHFGSHLGTGAQFDLLPASAEAVAQADEGVIAGLMQGLDTVQQSTGLPWWAVIVLTAAGVPSHRCCMMCCISLSEGTLTKSSMPAYFVCHCLLQCRLPSFAMTIK